MWQPIVRLSTSLGRDNRCSARLLGAVAVISCIMVIFNSNAPAPAAVERTTRQAAASPCLRLFGMSESRRFWEPPSQPSPAACLGSGVPPQHAGPCLTELRRRRGRPAHVAFIGDSRARVLFLTLCETLGLTRRQDVSHWYSQVEHHEQYLERGRRLQCPYYTPMSKHGHTGKYWSERPCFMEAFSDPVRVVAHWTPFLVTGYLERLQAMEEDCGSGLACPDVVIMTLGMWYAVATSAHPHLNTPDRLLLFRDDVNTLVPVLQRLARRTQLVYRMDGAHFTEIAFPGNKSNINAGLLTTNDIAMETFRRKTDKPLCPLSWRQSSRYATGSARRPKTIDWQQLVGLWKIATGSDK